MDLQTLLVGFLNFLNNTVIPFLLVIATLMFVWNGVRYFVIGGANEESQEKARSLALWGILGFVIVISLWGIVLMISSGLGLNNRVRVPDYMCEKGFGFCGATRPNGNSNSTDGFNSGSFGDRT